MEGGDPGTSFKDLPPSCIVNIFSRLAPTECAAAACVNLLWSQVAAEDSLWKPHLAADYATNSCSSYDGAAAASYKAAYSSWRSHYADVHGPLLARALAAWSKVRAWLGQHSPRILETLNPGASEAEVTAAEAALGHPLPSAMRVIYRVHNGQTLLIEQQSCEEGPPADLLMGMFGTTAFYDHVTSTQLAPLDKLVRVTRLLRSMRPLGAGQTMLTQSEVVYAHSFRMSDKLCVVDCSTGAVALKLANRDWPIAPPQDTYPGACDGMLRWFEEYASRLSAGMYCTCAGEAAIADAGLNEGQAISLFPQTYPHAATAITKGVKVTWSSVLVPQESRQGRLMFAYKVAFSLLTPQQQQDTLTQLAAQQSAWQQRLTQQQQQRSAAAAVADVAPAGPAIEQQQQQQGGSHAGSAHAAAAAAGGSGVEGSTSPGSKPYRQAVLCGSCDASAGAAAVPPVLGKPVPWSGIAAGAADDGGSSGGSSGSGPNRVLWLLVLHSPGPMDPPAAESADAAEAAAAAAAAQIDDEFAGFKLKGGPVSGRSAANIPGPLPRYGSAGGLHYMLTAAPASQVVGVCRSKPLSLQPLDVLDRDTEPAAVGCVLGQLKRLQDEAGPGGLPPQVDLRSELKDLKLSFDLSQLLVLRGRLTEEAAALTPHGCPGTPPQAALVRSEGLLRRRLQELSHDLSDASLQQMPEFHQRVSVLQQLGYVSPDGTVTLKGRAACEINSTQDELLSTELLFRGLLSGMAPEEAVALMSALVFQEKSDVQPELPPRLADGWGSLQALAVELAQLQGAAGLPLTPEDYCREVLHPGLMQVVYEWARGTPFSAITPLTDVMEGSIVRAVVRLDQCCRELMDAARVMGDTALFALMEAASGMIRRDIVFAASLYVA